MEEKKKSASPSLHGARSRPPAKRGTKLHNTGSNPTTHHESFMEWWSREETIIKVLCHPVVPI